MTFTQKTYRSLIARLDAETGEALEQRYKSSCLPLPLFIRDLLRQWQPQSLMFPIESTERWRHGWNVGVMVVPNDVGAKNFIDWFENKPAEVIDCDGSLGTVQFLKLRRQDGDICQLAYGNWVEAIAFGTALLKEGAPTLGAIAQ